MPRCSREGSSSSIYHIMLRGNNKEPVFIAESDKKKIFDTLIKIRKENTFSLYAYCILDNHIHLVLKEGTESIAEVVKRIATSYAIYYNRKYERVGHVFQDRFRSECVDNDQYLLSVIRYVHQNPVKARAGTIEGYKWSSYCEYLNKGSDLREVIDILMIFSEKVENARKMFTDFNKQAENEDFIDVRDENSLSQKDMEILVNEYLVKADLSYEELRHPSNRNALKALLNGIMGEYNVSSRHMSDILGIGRETIRKLAK